jgi:spore germination protein
MQARVLGDHLRWMDVELALASEKSRKNNSIADGFKAVDHKVGEYPEIDWGPSVAALYEKRKVTALGGNAVTVEDVKRAAVHFLNVTGKPNVRVIENGKGTEFASYTALVKHPRTGVGLSMDFTRNEGKMIRYTNPRPIGKPVVGLDQAVRKGALFLKTKDYPIMKPVSVDKYDGAVNLTYVTMQNGVLIYPENLTVKVALDNGEVVGLQAVDFVYEHHKRNIPKPEISRASAQKLLNPGFASQNYRLALIDNDLKEEVLCHEFTGRINGGVYRIYINAVNGTEEKIERMDKK